MAEAPQYDLTPGHLLFIMGERDPMPVSPPGWVVRNHPIQVDAMEHGSDCHKKGVGIDALGKPSVRIICLCWDPQRFRLAESVDSPMNASFMEVYRNDKFGMRLGLVAL